MYSRFQIFGFNSIRYRKNVLKLALDDGMKPYTESFKKFQRLVTADSFMLVMAALLPFSIFDTVTPPPLNYVNGFTSFLFGNDDEKKKAFFGVLPYPMNVLQPIIPVGSRPLTALIALGMGNTDTFNNMAITMFPFGRLGKSLVRMSADPSVTVEEMTGFPLKKISMIVKKSIKDDANDNILGTPNPIF